MKIRIKENSLRIRLLKSEVDKLETEGYLEAETSFVNKKLVYALESTEEGSKLTVDFIDNKITMFVPTVLLKGWAGNSIVGFDAHMPLSESDSLFLLLEKDFVCTDATMEDQSDNFLNPNKTC